MIEALLKELKETWGYDTKELNDIREKMEEFGSSVYETGYQDGMDLVSRDKSFIYGKTYGKKSDNDE